MNILIINHYAGAPSHGMEYRHYYLAREWKKAGHKVLIAAASFTHLRSKQFEIDKNTQLLQVDGIDYLIFKTSKYNGNGLDRIINIIYFLLGLRKNSKYLAEKFNPDIVITSSTFTFDIYTAKKIAKKAAAKLVFEVHDLWPLSIIELGGYSKWHPYICLMQLTENYAYRNSDFVVSLLPKALEYLKLHGLKPEKFVYIPNGIVTEDWNMDIPVPEEILSLLSKLKRENKKIIGYAGNHGIANALDSIIKAMNLLQDENVALLMIGQGPEKDNLIELVKKLNLKNVFFIPSVLKNVIPSLLNELDILYVGLQNQPVFRFGISPNKLIDYMMAGKPIIQAIKAGNDIVAEANCGVSVEPENPTAIAEAVKYLLSLTDEELRQMGANGKSFCLLNNDYKVLSNHFLEAVT